MAKTLDHREMIKSASDRSDLVDLCLAGCSGVHDTLRKHGVDSLYVLKEKFRTSKIKGIIEDLRKLVA